jgi:hypothetical protein
LRLLGATLEDSIISGKNHEMKVELAIIRTFK